MEIVLVLMCVGSVLSVQLRDTDRHTYCESCLTVAQEIEETLREASPESRLAVAENLIDGDVCKKLQSNKRDLDSNHKLMSSCNHLLESNHDKFSTALKNKEPKNLDIVLCYEQSTACVGVKRQSFQGSKATFRDSDVEALLRENRERVRVAQAVRSDEL